MPAIIVWTGREKPDEQTFLALVEYMVALQRAGKAYYIIDEWSAKTHSGGLDRAIRQWAVATYLMGKENASGVYISGEQGYGEVMPQWPELGAKIGRPLGAMHRHKPSGVYLRNYSSGLAIVNAANRSATVRVESGYTDCYGAAVPAALSMGPQTGAVLLRHDAPTQSSAPPAADIAGGAAQLEPPTLRSSAPPPAATRLSVSTADATPFEHRWKKCVGGSHAALGLRADWQAQLQQVHTELGFERIRFHGIFSGTSAPETA